MKTEIINRINALRGFLAQENVHAVIIPQTDPHQSEYIAAHWEARRFLSGFTGSAGTLVVTTDKALLWTDSRYFIQAAAQLQGTGIELMKEGLPATPDIIDYLIKELPAGARVGFDGWLFSVDSAARIAALLEKHGLQAVTNFDPVDAIWPERPLLPQGAIFVHDIKYAGESASDKIAKIVAKAKEEGADAVFISALDEIAWTLNIRSRDVKCNPVATAYLLLTADGSTLLTDPAKVDDSTRAYLNNNGVKVEPYSTVADFLAALPSDAKVLAQPDKTSHAAGEILGDRMVKASSPVPMLKACKNDIQISGTRAAMERDGVAMVRALMEIERKLKAGEKMTEISISDMLTDLRSRQDLYFDNSFDTIAGFRDHGAIVHYTATEATDVELQPDGLLLIDSGAQYLDGTTDITRTISLGNPTDLQRHDFTLVMKGHIALGSMIFLTGTTGHQLDAIARQFLWKEGLSYLHGTGHGVGHFLNVHEGPQSIRLNYVPTPLTPGMITSNEPGLYREGVHGIRCENLVLTVPAMTTDFGEFLRFETLTLCPFDRSLFDTSLMSDEEIAWVNAYHAEVRERLTPMLTAEEAAWLAAATAPIGPQIPR